MKKMTKEQVLMLYEMYDKIHWNQVEEHNKCKNNNCNIFSKKTFALTDILWNILHSKEAEVFQCANCGKYYDIFHIEKPDYMRENKDGICTYCLYEDEEDEDWDDYDG